VCVCVCVCVCVYVYVDRLVVQRWCWLLVWWLVKCWRVGRCRGFGNVEHDSMLHLSSNCLLVAGGGLRRWRDIHRQDIHWRCMSWQQQPHQVGGDGGVRCERLSLKQAPPINPAMAGRLSVAIQFVWQLFGCWLLVIVVDGFSRSRQHPTECPYLASSWQ